MLILLIIQMSFKILEGRNVWSNEGDDRESINLLFCIHNFVSDAMTGKTSLHFDPGALIQVTKWQANSRICNRAVE